ncbi:MAG TPA: hypothetical protein ENH75_09690 [archaeon]|nr:hypothetical protein [archaeon]
MSDQEDLKTFVKTDIIKSSKKVKGKHSPISEVVDDVLRVLKVQAIYDLNQNHKNFYLFNLKNYFKKPKIIYFLSVMLANNSSDLLVQLAGEYLVKHELKIIQYSIFPETLRVPLLLLKEIKIIDDYTHSIKALNKIRNKFRNKILRLKNLVENE